LGGPLYDASANNGSQLASGGSITVSANGQWYANSANFTTPRTSTAQTEIIKFTGGTFNRNSGYINGYAMVDDQPYGIVLPIGQSSYMPIVIDMVIPAGSLITAAWYDARPLSSTSIFNPGNGSTTQYDFLPGYYDLKTSATGI